MERLANKIAIVTGGGSGIGRAFCQRFAADGAKVIVADIDTSSAERAAREIASTGAVAKAVCVDVTSLASVEAAFRTALDAFDHVDILVNNAGIFPVKPIPQITDADWDQLLDINLKGTFLCSQAAARHMIPRRQGKIINISSESFPAGAPNYAHYVASKGGVVGLTRAMARELGPHGINVNCISPGLVVTDTARRYNPPELYALVRNGRAIQRDECPEDLTGAAVFFASADADFVTGQNLIVGGGYVF